MTTAPFAASAGAASSAPSATYRLQLTPDFPFAAAEAAVPYLARLGVSHLHLSPVLEAVPGSLHGYDVTDHGRVRSELGGEDGLRALSATARAHGLGLVLDIVPNHMAASPRHNHALWEVLREGPQSPYARWFDIDWQAGGGQVLLPVLGRRLGRELAELRVEGEVLRYHDLAFPLRKGTEDRPLPELLDAQWYRLAWWRIARTELNYRRFFTISDLIGVRVEDPEVFEATHGKLLQLLDEGVAHGLRVDHPDGLADPGAYLRRLHEATGGRWTVVEKILADGERLEAGWPVAGTTGYDALRHVDGLFVDPAGAGELLGQYRRFTNAPADRGGDWEETVRRAAYKVVTRELAAEVERLVRTVQRCATAPEQRDHAPWAVRTALRELLVRLQVYRPYGTGESVRRVLTDEAAAAARTAFTVPEEAEAVDLVRELLLGHEADPAHTELRARFAQTASALRAKAVEDTACYRYTPLLSAAEVGGEPGRPALAPAAFHAFCTRMQRDWPTGGTVLSTHDTKRSADVRLAIDVLSEVPDRWAELLARVTTAAQAAPAPDPQLAWAAWQTAVGIGFPHQERMRAVLLKHAREAGLFTSWTEADPSYEAAVEEFVDAGPSGPPLYTVAEFLRPLRPHIATNVLSAALLHLTMPGVPDLYQGTEQLYQALVDPDNRRPVQFQEARFGRLEEERGRWGLDEQKLFTTVTALRVRREQADCYGEFAGYVPLEAEGPAAGHCVAFARTGIAGAVVTVATRLSLRLAESGGWRDTALTLPPGRYVDALAEEERVHEGRVRLEELLGAWGIALLVPDGD
ncbi:malto-oligosyltrehalose synthase [Streptomyces indicus]|uniref:(1->4)-alpha-D-glucan 1-alpha-D-glucosylmutase n=1 Tax=Streptomyces indicus TaxID=417292 RepID=A0A1G8V8J5_9ACTN|nr:malto-oligosyltrehalose synthase [Streptomyces indicus]SDJ62167.1 (1->4)-alpha-D-glucan 1-alpha-D-glucosylmutase [Streptomyces indicus]